MSKDWTKAIISPDADIGTAIRAIDKGGLQIALVSDSERRLLGVLTDGDVRRGIVNKLTLEDSVLKVMNSNPITVHVGENREHILSLMKTHHIRQVPHLDEQGKIVGITMSDELIDPEPLPNWAFLMAGGLGSRLRPLTENIPKPLLKVGGKPIIETVLENLIDCGFVRFYVSVNYKAEMIEDYLGDGSAWGVDIRYIKETERLGTAGSLSLIPDTPEHPILVTNGDLLTNLNFNHLIDFHKRQDALATMCVREHQLQIPYGVVNTDKFYIRTIEEKPLMRLFINAGMYLLEPELLFQIPKGKYFDMPELFEILISNGDKTAAFPLREYWRDVGQLNDFEIANVEFTQVFG